MFDMKSNIAAQEAFGREINTGRLNFESLVAYDSIDNDPAPDQTPVPHGYPHVEDILTLDQAADALAAVETGHAKGKVVIQVS